MADILTEAQLTAFLPGLSGVTGWTGSLNAAMDRFEINTPQRGAAFLAQIAHESGEFKRLVENLNYSAPRLCVVWPGRFPSLDAAKPYENNPQALARPEPRRHWAWYPRSAYKPSGHPETES